MTAPPRWLRAQLPRATAAAWPKVAAVLPTGGYLAGGTALAVHLRHRVSRDLDVFTEVDFDPEELRARLAEAGELLVTLVAAGTLNGLLDGARVQFLHAGGQRSLADPSIVWGMPVAGLPDLIAMKLAALQRGELRDYFDLKAVEERTPFTVEQGLAFFRDRYAPSLRNPDATTLEIVRALGWLDDVPADPAVPEPHQTVAEYWRRRAPEVEQSLSDGPM